MNQLADTLRALGWAAWKRPPGGLTKDPITGCYIPKETDMTKLLLTRAILDRDVEADAELNSGQYVPTLVGFTQRDEETNEVRRIVGLDAASVQEMGDPDQITISVEAGAKLEPKA